MRKVFIPFIAIMTAFVLLQSCQKEIDFGEETNNPVTGDFRAKIEGTQWVANKGAGASRMQGLINLSGYSTDKKYLTITLTDSGVHRYILSDATMNAAAYIDSSLANPLNFSSNQGNYPSQCGGEVNITSIDTVNKKMSGTFFFKVFRVADGIGRNITEGSFSNLSYTTTLPPASATDTFRVKIAGTQWIPPVILAAKAPAVPPLPATIGISGTDATASKTVGLIFPADITPGSYTLDFFGATYIGQYNPNSNPQNSQASVSGTLQIISHNPTTKRIRGNFNFRSEELLNPLAFTLLTEGYFSITYQ
jgi:hypothetical protein